MITGSGVSRPEYYQGGGGGASTCIGVIMAHDGGRKVLNYYLFVRGVVDVATYVTTYIHNGRLLLMMSRKTTENLALFTIFVGLLTQCSQSQSPNQTQLIL